MHDSKIVQRVELERIVVVTPDGRSFDLGSPNSRLFRARVWFYKRRRGFRG